MLNNKFKKGGIYCIKNLKSGKVYIGSSNNLKHRFKEHLKDLYKNKHHCEHLQRAYKKYGAKYFKFCIIEYIQNPNLLHPREQYWFLYYGVGDHTKCYNTSIDAFHPTRNRKMSSEFRLKVSQRTKGRKLSAEHKRKISNANKGKKWSPQTRDKIRNYRKNTPLTMKQRQHLDNLNKRQKGGQNPRARKVICLDNTRIYDTLQEAALSCNVSTDSMRRMCNNCSPNTKNFHYLWLDDYNNMSTEDILQIKSKSYRHSTSRAVYCLEQNKTFMSLKEAALYFKVCCDSIRSWIKKGNNDNLLGLTFLYL